MAKRVPKRKNQTSFTKGNKKSVGNNATRGKAMYDREELIARKIDNRTITRYLTLNSHLTPRELLDRLREEDVSTLEAMIIKAMLKGYRTGDVNQLNFFFERLVGKVPNQIKHSVDNPYDGMSDEELLAEKRRVTEINRKTMRLIEQTNPRRIEEESIARAIEESTPEPDYSIED